MVGLIEEPERLKRLAKNFGAALLECLLEDGELIALACVALRFVIPFCLVGLVGYHLMFDPDGVGVASRWTCFRLIPTSGFPDRNPLSSRLTSSPQRRLLI
jgi:hypothetical protein